MEAITLSIAIAVGLILLALAFDFVNGFHDTANAVATIIYSGAMKENSAIFMSATLNALGAILVGSGVAKFITQVIPKNQCSMLMIGSVLLAGLAWNICTWLKCLPVSSTHCLIGSLVGGGLAAGGIAGVNPHKLWEALISLLLSPITGFVLCLVIAWLLNKIISRLQKNEDEKKPYVEKILPYMQIGSSACVSFAHGSNDGQKTMGIIFLILTTQFGLAHNAPMPLWVKLAAAIAIGLGTAIGGKRVIRTVGEKLSHKGICTVHGCAAEGTTALTVFFGTWLGLPISTTHVLNAAVVGGTFALHGHKHANLGTMKSMALAWVLTLPVTCVMSYTLYTVLTFFT